MMDSCGNISQHQRSSVLILIFTQTILISFTGGLSANAFTPQLQHCYQHCDKPTLQYTNFGVNRKSFDFNFITTSTTSTLSTHSSTSLQVSFHRGDEEREEERNGEKISSSVENQNRESEFNFEPRAKSAKHEQRIQDQIHVQNTFVSYGDELWKLRSTLLHLSKQLMNVISQSEDEKHHSVVSEQELCEMIREVETKDPEFVYAFEREQMQQALQEDRLEDAKNHKEKAMTARGALPHFNLHGLWVGKYGDKGFQMVNITYVGDTLIARKVTGDENVPAGEISFQADLSPPDVSFSASKKAENHNTKQPLSNIVLSDRASKKWNTNELSRYAGLGQVAEKGHVNEQWTDGQLVFINEDYFSFAWLPLHFQILFGRPTYGITVDLMSQHQQQVNPKDSLVLEYEEEELCPLPPDLDDGVDATNQHVINCFESTVQLVEECSIQDDSSSCIFYDEDPNSCCFE
jgi:hypothetical protein